MRAEPQAEVPRLILGEHPADHRRHEPAGHPCRTSHGGRIGWRYGRYQFGYCVQEPFW